MQLFKIAEGFQHQQIGSAFSQGLDLLAESLASFCKRSLAQRLDSCSQWANRTSNPNIEALSGVTGEPCSHSIHFVDFVGQAMAGEAERVCPERVSFNNLRSGLQIIVMDSADQFGPGRDSIRRNSD